MCVCALERLPVTSDGIDQQWQTTAKDVNDNPPCANSARYHHRPRVETFFADLNELVSCAVDLRVQWCVTNVNAVDLNSCTTWVGSDVEMFTVRLENSSTAC